MIWWQSLNYEEWIIILYRCVNSGESLTNMTKSPSLLILWVIRRSLHIDKIHKNKIHSYYVIIS